MASIRREGRWQNGKKRENPALLKIAAENNSARIRWVLVCQAGTLTDAYADGQRGFLRGMIKEKGERRIIAHPLGLIFLSAEGQNRTADTGIFRHYLQVSYIPRNKATY